MEKHHLPDFQSAQERTDYIRDNADHFTVTFRSDLQNHTFSFLDLPTARMSAVLAANVIKRPVMIYAVLAVYDSWVETVFPNKDQLSRFKPDIIKALERLKQKQGSVANE